MSSTGFHEAEHHLEPPTRDMHRAIVSLMEELEAIEVLPPEALPWTNDGVSRRQRRMMDRGIGRGISRTDSSRCTSNVTIWVRDG